VSEAETADTTTTTSTTQNVGEIAEEGGPREGVGAGKAEREETERETEAA
jgi:hypothetical protein